MSHVGLDGDMLTLDNEPVTSLDVCPRCSAVVAHLWQHEEWHQKTGTATKTEEEERPHPADCTFSCCACIRCGEHKHPGNCRTRRERRQR